MKGKYITLQIRLACITKPAVKKDLYKELETTIREQRRIMQLFIKPEIRLMPIRRKEQMAI